MRIAFVHSFYRRGLPSGENSSVQAWYEALENAGHVMRFFGMESDAEVERPGAKVRLGLRVATGLGPNPVTDLLAFRPDVVHVHNLFPNFGTRWLKSWSGPLVATLHNYRSVCANGSLFRDDKICLDCPSGKPWQSVLSRCYRGSSIATAPLAIRNWGGAKRDHILARADEIVVLSDHSKRIFASLGVPDRLMTVVPSMAWRSFEPNLGATKDYWIHVGRLDAYKGISELLSIWPVDEKLVICGSGPLEGQLRQLTAPNISFQGHVPDRKLLSLLSGARGFIFPSRWYETQGMSACEALGSGVPVATLPNNAVGEMVSKHHLGSTYQAGDQQSLVGALNYIVRGGEHLRRRCRSYFERSYSSDRYVASMERVYLAAMKRNKSRMI